MTQLLNISVAMVFPKVLEIRSCQVPTVVLPEVHATLACLILMKNKVILTIWAPDFLYGCISCMVRLEHLRENRDDLRENVLCDLTTTTGFLSFQTRTVADKNRDLASCSNPAVTLSSPLSSLVLVPEQKW